MWAILTLRGGSKVRVNMDMVRRYLHATDGTQLVFTYSTWGDDQLPHNMSDILVVTETVEQLDELLGVYAYNEAGWAGPVS